MNRVRLAVLDDWEHQWAHSPRVGALHDRFEVTIFPEALASGTLVESLAPFEVLVLNRERTPLDASLIAALPNLRVVANTGTGIPHIDRAALDARGIQIITTPGGTTAGVIEQTFALLLAIVKDVPALDASMRAREPGWTRPVVGDLVGKRFGIAGPGSIGAATAQVARAFGMDVHAWGRNLTPDLAAARSLVYAPTLRHLAASVDVLSLHLRLTAETRGIVNADILGALRPGAILINTARAELVDEAALAEKLATSDLRVGLDVFTHEPPTAHDPIRQARGVLSPHVGWMTEATWDRFIASIIASLIDTNGAD